MSSIYKNAFTPTPLFLCILQEEPHCIPFALHLSIDEVICLDGPVCILLYVDDLVITGPRLDEIGRVKS